MNPKDFGDCLTSSSVISTGLWTNTYKTKVIPKPHRHVSVMLWVWCCFGRKEGEIWQPYLKSELFFISSCMAVIPAFWTSVDLILCQYDAQKTMALVFSPFSLTFKSTNSASQINGISSNQKLYFQHDVLHENDEIMEDMASGFMIIFLHCWRQ